MSTQKFFYLNPSAIGVTNFPASVQLELQSILSGGSGGGTGPGTSTTYEAAEDIGGHSAITLNTAGKAIKATNTNSKHSAAILGVTSAAVTTGSQVAATDIGLVTNPGWGLTIDMPVYLGLNGVLTQTIPVSPSFIKQLGIAISSDSVLVSIETSIII